MSQISNYSSGGVIPPGTVLEIDGDTGTGAVGPIIDLHAQPQAGATVIFDANASLITLNVTDASDNTLVGLGAGNNTLTSTACTGFGFSVLNSLTTAVGCSAFGANALLSNETGDDNSFFGTAAGNDLISSPDNVGIGTNALGSLQSGPGSNTALGTGSATALINGDGNISIGATAGIAWTSNESDNICIGNQGVTGQSGVITIGTNAVQTSTFIAGIDGVNVGSTAKVVTMGTAGTADQLGTATISAGTNITITPGANTITISANPDLDLTYTAVNTTPYVVLATDQFLGVNSSGSAITIQLPNAPSTGRVIVIKDTTGSANTNNITVTTVGGAVNIDGATSYTMNTQYAAIQVIFTGSAYSIF